MVHERDSDRSMVLQLELELDLDLGGTWMPQEPEQLLVRRNEELNKHSNHNPFFLVLHTCCHARLPGVWFRTPTSISYPPPRHKC
jgi:hypothetical protein